ncbi:MAG: hypothetical protein JNK86_01360 [Alphaproteobacteria bacterium]|nr:hypothetical protein [Alphaproteobacteria bacterium]
MVDGLLHRCWLVKAAIGLLLGCLGACQQVGSSEHNFADRTVIIKSSSLIGQSPEQIGRILGPATFKRRDHPAELWQFQSPDCVTDIFFFTKNNLLTVTHVISRSRSGETIDNDLCLVKFAPKSI